MSVYFCPDCEATYGGDATIREAIKEKFPGESSDFYDFFEDRFNMICPNCGPK